MAPGLNMTSCLRKATSNGAWQGDSPIEFSLSLLIVQICLILALTRTLAFFLKPLRQPRVIAEIIGGIMLGPSLLGRNKDYMAKIFPMDSMTVLETVANLGLVLFLFLVGVDLELTTIQRTGRQAMLISFAGIAIPFAAGTGVSFVLFDALKPGGKFSTFLVFMGVAMSITAFPVLARILTELKLLTKDVGQLALSAAAVDDMSAWILLALAIAMSGGEADPAIAVWILMCGATFVVFMFAVVKPVMGWLVRHTMEEKNKPINEVHVTITLVAVLAAAFTTDAIGIHSIFGAFIFGLIIPKEGPFATSLTKKIEDLVTILMLPLYFAASGLKTNIRTINSVQSGLLLILVIVTACAGKILGVFLVSVAHRVPTRKALALGLLMNTKGLVELIVLNIGKDRKVLNEEAFAIMVIMALFTTFLTTPAIMAVYKPARSQVPHKRRTIEQGEEKLRLLACINSTTNLNALMSLVEVSRGTHKRAVKLFIVHLVELLDMSSSIISDENKGNFESGARVATRFESFMQLSKVIVRLCTDISEFDDMHTNICRMATEKRACLILLPFHKCMHLPGTEESYNPGFRSVNRHVLQNAPCSVGVLIDHGMGLSKISSSEVRHNVVVFFFGGPDDREALMLGYRMAEHPGVHLKVIQFLAASDIAIQGDHHVLHIENRGNNFEVATPLCGSSHNSQSTILAETYNFVEADIDGDLDMKLDEECLVTVKTRSMLSSSNMSYEDMVTSDPLESVKELAKNNSIHLILVGISRRPSPILSYLAGTLVDQCAELGPIGDALASSDKDIHASVLVVQQYDPSLKKRNPFNKTIDKRKSYTSSSSY